MKTAYALLLDRCGLSHREAADFHAVRPDTVSSWASGRNRVPDGAVTELRALYAKQCRAADEALIALDESRRASASPPEVVEIGLASTDDEAHSLGWPCVGAMAASIGMAIARAPYAVRIVERGATIATSAAKGAHFK